MQDIDGQLAPFPQLAAHILTWNTHQVHLLLCSLELNQYEPQLLENDITGEVLIHMDHEALRDIGVHSVGQRLTVLKSVYSVKIRDEVPIEEGHWSPPTEDMEQILLESPSGVIPPRRMFEMLCERDDRIKGLELEIKRLSDSLSGFRDEMQAISKALYSRETLPDPYGRASKVSKSPTASNFPHPLSNAATNDRLTGLSRSNSLQHPSTTQFFGRLPSPGIPSWQSTNNEGLSPLPSPSGSPAVSSQLPVSMQQQQQTTQPSLPASEVLSDQALRSTWSTTTSNDSSSHLGTFASHVLPPPTPSGLPNTASNPATPTHPSPVTTLPQARLTQSANGLAFTQSQSSHASPQWAFDSSQIRPGTAPVASISATPTSGATASSSTNATARSFKVTLEDPCYKVLPAALRKYKINDDWRDYALFICYGGGTEERCLSYDEKPLLLFQKLKEAGQNPVFMLRHIRDIKAPILTAAAKHALRREKRAKEKVKAEADGTAQSGTTEQDDGEKSKPKPGPHPHPLPSPTSAPVKGYCISIYPYMSEREDEFDVTVGDTFVILSKTKGWWIVYRQSDDRKLQSGFVPAGCLLEISRAPSELLTSAKDSMNATLTNAAAVPIDPNFIVSVSTPGIALMDYKAVGSDELPVIKGDLVRVYKRYNHWSYAVKEDSGLRGWLPSWFVGKLAKTASNGTAAAPQNTAQSPATTKPSVSSESVDASHPNGMI